MKFADIVVHWSDNFLVQRVVNIGCKDLKAIASHMMLDFWEKEREFQGLDHYHFIDNTGLLSVEEVQAISREVW